MKQKRILNNWLSNSEKDDFPQVNLNYNMQEQYRMKNSARISKIIQANVNTENDISSEHSLNETILYNQESDPEKQFNTKLVSGATETTQNVNVIKSHEMRFRSKSNHNSEKAQNYQKSLNLKLSVSPSQNSSRQQQRNLGTNKSNDKISYFQSSCKNSISEKLSHFGSVSISQKNFKLMDNLNRLSQNNKNQFFNDRKDSTLQKLDKVVGDELNLLKMTVEAKKQLQQTVQENKKLLKDLKQNQIFKLDQKNEDIQIKLIDEYKIKSERQDQIDNLKAHLMEISQQMVQIYDQNQYEQNALQQQFDQKNNDFIQKKEDYQNEKLYQKSLKEQQIVAMKFHKENLKKTKIVHQKTKEESSLKDKEFRNRMNFLSQSKNQMEMLVGSTLKSKSMERTSKPRSKKNKISTAKSPQMSGRGSPQNLFFKRIVNDLDLSQKKSTNPRKQIPQKLLEKKSLRKLMHDTKVFKYPVAYESDKDDVTSENRAGVSIQTCELSPNVKGLNSLNKQSGFHQHISQFSNFTDRKFVISPSKHKDHIVYSHMTSVADQSRSPQNPKEQGGHDNLEMPNGVDDIADENITYDS